MAPNLRTEPFLPLRGMGMHKVTEPGVEVPQFRLIPALHSLSADSGVLQPLHSHPFLTQSLTQNPIPESHKRTPPQHGLLRAMLPGFLLLTTWADPSVGELLPWPLVRPTLWTPRTVLAWNLSVSCPPAQDPLTFQARESEVLLEVAPEYPLFGGPLLLSFLP